jgi:glycosyltransferase involved in cell wall biosynthesis
LVISRLIPYKRVDIAVAACNKLKKRLVVAGRGSELKNLQKLAGSTVEFQEYPSDEEVEKLYLNCKALLFPGYEDFGITPVEAMAAGKPVICYGQGGATESVVDGKTGVFFDKQTASSLEKAITSFEEIEFNKESIRKRAEEFSEKQFLESIGGYIDEVLGKPSVS